MAYQCHKLGAKQGMKIGYARVSTEDQNPDLQLTALKQAGCDKIFTDKATGTNTKRAALAKCLKALKAGAMLTVWKLDRLGRSLLDLITLLDDLKAQSVAFQSLTEAIDAETATGRAAAVARGVRMGRKRLLTLQQVAHARKLIEQGEGPDKVAKSLFVSRRTLYRALGALRF
jgi:DNA invertase Pin-like site-specific DNA recombinase